MSTDELERLERRLEAALHGADDRPVDLPAGRAVLVTRLGRQQQQVRRWAVAASVVAVVVTTSVVVSGLRDDSESLPAAPPEITLSPSGLPVGVLTGRVDRTQPHAGNVSRVRILVRADGTGIWNAGSPNDGFSPSVADYPVEFVSNGPGRAIMRFDGYCTGAALTLDFIVRDRTVLIEEATTANCVVNGGLGQDLPGTALRIRPLPPGS